MLDQPAETYVAWAITLLLAGFALAIVGGILVLHRARRLPYLQLRRRAILRGWKLVFFSAGLLLAAGLTERFGPPLLEQLARPTPTSLPSPTRISFPTSTTSPSPASVLRLPSASPTPSPGPTLSPTQ